MNVEGVVVDHFYFVVNIVSLLKNNTYLLLSVSVGDFQQPFEINVELKGVMQDASVLHINNVHQIDKTKFIHFF